MLKEANQELTLNQIEAAQAGPSGLQSTGRGTGRQNNRVGRAKSERGFQSKRAERGSKYVSNSLLLNFSLLDSPQPIGVSEGAWLDLESTPCQMACPTEVAMALINAVGVRDQYMIVMVCPVWPSKPWYPLVLELVCDTPRILRNGCKLPTSPSGGFTSARGGQPNVSSLETIRIALRNQEFSSKTIEDLTAILGFLTALYTEDHRRLDRFLTPELLNIGPSGRSETESSMIKDIGTSCLVPRTCKVIRSQITRTSRKITNIIQAEGSRGAIQGLVNHTKSLLDTACKLQQQFIDVVDDATVAKQYDIHLNYVQQVGLVVSSSSTFTPNPYQQESISSYVADAAREELQQLELAIRNNTTPDNERGESRVRRWVEGQQLRRQEDSAPDAWIDLYRDGRLHTNRREFSGTSSSIRAELGDFNGKALEWFSWIDLFRALVHDTPKSPAEKLAILQRHLRGDVLDVLPFADRLAWNTDRGDDLERRSLNEFGNLLFQRAMAYQNAYTIAAEQSRDRRRATPYFCFKCEGRHPMETCAQFKELASKDRLLFCMRHKLCFNCFGTHHTSRECKIKKHCNVTGCKHWHHVLLHDVSVKPENCSATARCNTTQIKTVWEMVQAQVYDVDGNIALANVFLGGGSSSTLFREGFIRKLRLDWTPHTLSVDGAGGVRSKYASRRVQVRLRLFDGEEVTLKGSTLPTVASPAPVLEWSALKQRWKHLQDLPLQPSGGRFEPTAILTRLGWIVRRVFVCGLLEAVVRSHAILAAGKDVDVLVQQMKQFCDSEEFGIKHQIPCMSESVKQAVQILEAVTRRLEVGYEVPITWKTREPNLSNNRSLAEKRRKSLLRRFYEEPIFKGDYRQAMEKNPEYYLVHHGVKNGNKWRVVFDAAAKFNGRCLNDSIHSGPALQNSLTSVIIKF
ncbi:Uncharacterized protein APZ42_010834 [Daphnia magna]|uniref:Peptidase aspartic putative domain-containing protein n=1 Tax=Daphnia magna TaxID=35525 RepID=A0A162TDB8_9CRUS|nr:Uncharacterized protein APZ42_010834 [Daphnia magna]